MFVTEEVRITHRCVSHCLYMGYDILAEIPTFSGSSCSIVPSILFPMRKPEVVRNPSKKTYKFVHMGIRIHRKTIMLRLDLRARSPTIEWLSANFKKKFTGSDTGQGTITSPEWTQKVAMMHRRKVEPIGRKNSDAHIAAGNWPY